jgi:hypothetical protein
MTTVTLAGESGTVTEIVEIGPVRYQRTRAWAGLGPLVDACSRAGLEATGLPLGPIPGGWERPDVWLLTDLPRAAAEAFGILDILTADIPGSSGLVMIGGAYSYEGLDRIGGWFDSTSAVLLPLLPPGEPDATEAPGGTHLVPTPSCPGELALIMSTAPPFFGYNKLEPNADATVLATFSDGNPALVVTEPAPRRTVAFASDLLPHWGPSAKDWDRLPAFLRSLVELAMGSSR